MAIPGLFGGDAAEGRRGLSLYDWRGWADEAREQTTIQTNQFLFPAGKRCKGQTGRGCSSRTTASMTRSAGSALCVGQAGRDARQSFKMTIRALRWILPVAMGSAGFAMLHGEEGPPAAAPGYSCGLNASEYFSQPDGGITCPTRNLARELGSQSEPDSMLAIKKVLEAHGCPTVGVKTDADFFLENKGPAIIHLQLSGYSLHPENHFTFLVEQAARPARWCSIQSSTSRQRFTCPGSRFPSRTKGRP